MGLNDDATLEDLRTLLGALALDAAEVDDDRAVEAALVEHPELGDELADLRAAAGWLGIEAAHEVPAELSSSVLAAALTRRSAGRHIAVDDVGVPTPIDALLGEADDLAELLAGLTDEQWRAPTRADLTVFELVGHLLGVEEYLGGLLGLWPFVVDPDVALDHLATTRPIIEANRDTAPADLAPLWRARLGAVAEGARARDNRDRFAFHHLDLSLRSLLYLRTFELWVHGDDIRAAIGQPASLGHAGRIHAMASMVANGLPLALALSGAEAPDASVRLVLTGPGGGVWQTALRSGGDATANPAAEITADVHDFCRMVGHRLDPSALGINVRGDAGVARTVLAAAQIFAA